MSRWLKRRPSAEFRLFGQALIALTAARLALHWVPLPTLKRRVWRTLSAAQPLPEEKRLPMARVLRCAAAASKLMPVSSTCLATAIVVQALLHRHGYTVQLRVGVHLPATGKFAAHAWLEHEGTVIVGGPASVVNQYQAMPGVEQLIA
jgi:hypothetical protein